MHSGGFLKLYRYRPRYRGRTLVKDTLDKAITSLVESVARIAVLGDRGTGKSSLCNAAFGKAFAATGPGRCVTSSITLYPATEKCPVNVYDTRGFETLSSNEDILHELTNLIAERKAAINQYEHDDPAAVTEQLHAIWWVIGVIGGGRFNPEHIERVGKLFGNEGIPVIMVLNKCDTEESYVNEVERSVREHCFWARDVVLLVPEPKTGPIKLLCESYGSSDINTSVKKRLYNCDDCDRRHIFKANYGVEDLIKVTARCLPKMVAQSFLSAQKVWLEGLDRIAIWDICLFSMATAGIGAAPISFLTRCILWPVQVLMIVRLAALYGVIMSWNTALRFCFSLGFVGTAGFVGWLGAGLLKSIPVLNLVGCATDAVVSLGCTAAMGLVSRELLRRVRGKALLDEKEVSPEDMAEIMNADERQTLFMEYFDKMKVPLQELLNDGVSAVTNAQVQEVIERAA